MWHDSFYGDGENMRSRTKFLGMMCGGPVVWGSKLQSTVALSTAEAEYMAICASVQEVLFLRQLLADLDHAPSGSTRMLENNNGCKAMATNGMTTAKSKHIDFRYHFIREVVKVRPSSSYIVPRATCCLSTCLHLHLVGRMLSGTYPGPKKPSNGKGGMPPCEQNPPPA